MEKPFRPTYEIDSKTWAAGQKLIFQLGGLPGGRLEHILFEIEATVTNSAAGAVSVYTQQLSRIIARLFHKSLLLHINTTGRKMWVDYRILKGKTINNNAQSVTGGGGTATFRLAMPVYLSDPRAAFPNDACQHTPLLEGKTLELECAQSAVIGTGGGGNQTASNITIRPVLHFIPDNADDEIAGRRVVPAKLLIDYEDWNQQDAFLKVGGAYSHLAIYDESDDAVDTAQYERIRVQLGGYDVVDRLRAVALIHDYNDRCASGGASAAGASDGIAETEQLAVTGSTLMIPVLVPPVGYKQSQLPDTDVSEGQSSSARCTITGTATSARWSYRMYADRTQAEMEEAARLLGIKEPSRAGYAAKTGSKVPLQGNGKRVAKMERRLPVSVTQ